MSPGNDGVEAARPRLRAAIGGTEAGQAIYSPLVLGLYDAYVLGFSNHILWRCPTWKLRQLYDRNVSRAHIDVGVGTGYFLDRTLWPVPKPKITLVDLNANSLRAASQRIARYSPRVVLADALEPLPEMGPFDSAALCYLLHCLPGTLPDKAAVFDRLRPLLAPSARVFGATIVQGSSRRSRAAQVLMDAYNRMGVFSNQLDSAEVLGEVLASRFADVRVELVGTVAVFEARAP